MNEYWLIPIALLTSTVPAVFGMGGGVLLITLMPGLVPPAAIIPLHAATQLASNGSRAAFGWRHIDPGLLPPFIVGGVAGAVAGAALFSRIDLSWLPALIGAVILVITWLPLPAKFRTLAPSEVTCSKEKSSGSVSLISHNRSPSAL